MGVRTIKLFAAYNAGANREMGKVLAALTPEEWDRDLKGYFNSVHSVCSHVYISDTNWLIRFKGLRPFRSLSVPLFDATLPWGETLFSSTDEYLKKRADLDAIYSAFAGELTDPDLEKTFSYSDSKGTAHTHDFGDCVLHVFNHQTHHRGMIALYLDILGKKNDFNSLLAYA